MLIEVKDVSFGYNSEVILSNVSLSVSYGDLVIIRGPSGSGKSSFLRLLNRLSDPTNGIILFNGRPLSDYKAVELRRQICYLQQTPLMAEGDVKHNLTLPFNFRSLRETPPPADEVLSDLLYQFRLTDVSLSDDATTLSIGQKQRLAFIRALLIGPKVLLLDEPTSALDPESRAIVEEHVEKLTVEQSMAAIMVSHLDFKPQRVKARRYLLSSDDLKEQVE